MINPWHIVMAVPVAYADHLNRCGAALDYGWSNFSLPLVTPPDLDTVTHYACDAPASEGFKLLAEAAVQGTLPAGVPWKDYGVTEAQAIAAFGAMLLDAEESGTRTPREHFDNTLSQWGLEQKIQDEI